MQAVVVWIFQVGFVHSVKKLDEYLLVVDFEDLRHVKFFIHVEPNLLQRFAFCELLKDEHIEIEWFANILQVLFHMIRIEYRFV